MAVHLAMESLSKGECKLALAGGVSIQEKQDGYKTAEGTLSKSGTVRPFDQYGDGFVPGNGGGLIAIKTLEAAIEDGDYIHAVITGSGISTDGKEKSGYSAPSVIGESTAIQRAVTNSGLSYGDISYVELHGTATQLGDVIEAETLKSTYGQAYRNSEKALYVGSVKSNVGHLNYAAGIAGIIKTVLMIKNRMLVPTVYFQQDNKKLGISKFNICVNRFTRKWNRQHLAAAVSSFGIGGVNCHLIIEEYKSREILNETVPKEELKAAIIPVSGPTKEHIKGYFEKLGAYLDDKKDVNIKDIARTLWKGRDAKEYRSVLLTTGTKDLSRQLKEAQVVRKSKAPKDIKTLFMFGGSNYYSLDKIAQLMNYDYRLNDHFNMIFECVCDLFGLNIKKKIETNSLSDLENYLLHFCVQYALGEYISDLGIEPNAVVGYSAGEYMAAYFAGVLSLEDTLKICVKRYHLFEQIQEGSMVSVMADEKKISKYMQGNLEIAAYNAPGRIMVAGPKNEIDKFCELLSENQIYNIKLPLDRAGHCKMVKQILPDLEEFLDTIEFYESEKDYFSTSLGRKIDSKILATKEYWKNQTLNSVKFQQAVEATQDIENLIAIEIGIGEQLCSFFNKSKKNKEQLAVPVITEKIDRWEYALRFGMGTLWTIGYEIPDWSIDVENGQLLDLPASSFQMKQYIKVNSNSKNEIQHRNNLGCEIVNGFMSHKLELCRKMLDMSDVQILTIAQSNIDIKQNQNKWKQLEIDLVEHSGIMCMAQMPELYHVYDEICARVAIKYFDEYGLFRIPGETISYETIIEKTSCISDYKILLKRLLGFMEKSGLIKEEGERWLCLKNISEVSQLKYYISHAIESFPDFKYFFELIEKCSDSYNEVLSGKVMGKEILYPNGSYDYVRNVFEKTPTYGKARLYAEIFSNMLVDMAKCANRKLRILELGAGSGIVTWPAIDKLRDYDIEYYFTDIGHSFIYDAKQKAEELGVKDKMKFARIDVNKSLVSQNIPEDYFDLVVSCGMIQSVPDMELALDNMRRGLVADGVLCLLQPINVHGIRELFGGLTTEWWNYAKDPLRESNYNILVKDWERLFLKHGFDSFIAFDGYENNVTDSAIIMGQLSYKEYKKNRTNIIDEYGERIHEIIINEPRQPIVTQKKSLVDNSLNQNDVQRKLVDILRNITEEEEIDLSHSLFELDIDSLTGLMIVSQINEFYEIQLTPKELILCDNLLKVAEKIQELINEKENI
ncbi:MAG: acyltransferase domain-containing protein [Pseudobutyrivibrio sp.]|nr:acyltransferase domain-containing protein [Pseudobutyrivibrio sp.]